MCLCNVCIVMCELIECLISSYLTVLGTGVIEVGIILFYGMFICEIDLISMISALFWERDRETSREQRSVFDIQQILKTTRSTDRHGHRVLPTTF